MGQKPELSFVKFSWNQMTAAQFEEHWKLKKTMKKADFIHMVQVGVEELPALRLCHIRVIRQHAELMNPARAAVCRPWRHDYLLW